MSLHDIRREIFYLLLSLLRTHYPFLRTIETKKYHTRVSHEKLQSNMHDNLRSIIQTDFIVQYIKKNDKEKRNEDLIILDFL